MCMYSRVNTCVCTHNHVGHGWNIFHADGKNYNTNKRDQCTNEKEIGANKFPYRIELIGLEVQEKDFKVDIKFQAWMLIDGWKNNHAQTVL